MVIEEESPLIFPTAHRTKHSKLVSYPVGAEILSRALDGVPQHGSITCTFSAGNPQRTISDEKTRVLEITYNKRERSFYDGEDAAARGVLNARWEIRVFDVPVTLRHEIKKLLVEDALPNAARKWLIASAALEGKIGNAAICFDYNKVDKLLIVSDGRNLAPEKIR